MAGNTTSCLVRPFAGVLIASLCLVGKASPALGAADQWEPGEQYTTDDWVVTDELQFPSLCTYRCTEAHESTIWNGPPSSKWQQVFPASDPVTEGGAGETHNDWKDFGSCATAAKGRDSNGTNYTKYAWVIYYAASMEDSHDLAKARTTNGDRVSYLQNYDDYVADDPTIVTFAGGGGSGATAQAITNFESVVKRRNPPQKRPWR
jgi:hypothetical protein